MIYDQLKTKQMITVLTIVFLLAALLSGCGANSESNDNVEMENTQTNTITDSALTVESIDPDYSDRDLDGTWDVSSATSITLEDNNIKISGSGAEVSQNTVTILEEGTFVLSGTLSDGQIVIDTTDSEKIQLVLNSASLSCLDNAPIYVKQADKVFLTLAEGTTNDISDNSTYALDEGDDEPNAAIFSKDDLTINGTGSLTVSGHYENGIASKDDLVIAGGTLNITAVKDGLRGRDSVAVYDGTITIQAGEDGIQSNNDEDAEKGWISIDGGTFNITAENDSIQAETILQVTNGYLNLKTGGGSDNTNNNINNPQNWGRKNPQQTITESETTTESAKGLKAGTALLISGGAVTIDSSDDAIHSNGNVLINAGILTLSSGDDGIHADSELVIDAGTIDVNNSYEGIEGKSITVNDGEIHVTATDDGFNAAGGNDGSSLNGRPGQNNFSESGDSYIRIAGGHIVVNASGDGIDSNGSLYVDAGTVLVNGPTNSGNGALDYNGSAEINGGIFVAAGSSGMAQNFSDSSDQNSLLIGYSSTQEAGVPVTLLDENDNLILSFTPSKTYQSIVVSSPYLEQSKAYTLYSGGNISGDSIDGLINDGSFSDGTKVVDITLSNISTSITDTGEAFSGGMGGGPGRGGPRGPGGDRERHQPPSEDSIMPQNEL